MAGTPYFPLYGGDWKKDDALLRCSLSARGAWIEMLLWMHEANTGKFVGTFDEVAMIVRGKIDEVRAAFREIGEKGAADISESGEQVTIVSRRVVRDLEKKRQASEWGKRGGNPSLRVGGDKGSHKARDKAHPTMGGIRPLEDESDTGSGSMSCSSEGGAGETIRAEALYAAYPRKVGRAVALKAIERAITFVADRQKSDRKTACAWLLERVTAYADSPSVKSKDADFIPHPSTWFNGGRYDDDPAEWARIASVNGSSHRPHPGTSRLAAASERRAAERAAEFGENLTLDAVIHRGPARQGGGNAVTG